MGVQSARTNQGGPRARTEQGNLKCSQSKRLWNPQNKKQNTEQDTFTEHCSFETRKAMAVQELRNHRGTENKKAR
mgnify:FL=1